MIRKRVTHFFYDLMSFLLFRFFKIAHFVFDDYIFSSFFLHIKASPRYIRISGNITLVNTLISGSVHSLDPFSNSAITSLCLLTSCRYIFF